MFVINITKTTNETVSNLIIKEKNIEYEALWKEHLHFPSQENIGKKRKAMQNNQENIFAIT